MGGEAPLIQAFRADVQAKISRTVMLTPKIKRENGFMSREICGPLEEIAAEALANHKNNPSVELTYPALASKEGVYLHG